MISKESFLFVISKSDRGSNYTSTTRKVVTIMPAGFRGAGRIFFFSDICRKTMKLKPKKLQFQTRYENRLMWPILLCKLLKMMTIHLGDAQTTTCVNWVIL